MSEEALKRIAECKRAQAKKLNLSGLGLEELPMELAELTWLEELDLSRNPITRPPAHPQGKSDNFFRDSPLGPLAPLTCLRYLILWGTQVADISPLRGMAQLQRLYLSGTQVTDLSPLRRMAQLQELGLSGTQVADISPLRGMAQLQELYLSRTQVADISPLMGMARLQRLDLESTQVADISPLRGMAQLQGLWLSGTRVADISPLRGMAQLQRLYLDGTQVADISPLRELIEAGMPVMLNVSYFRNSIFLQDCPLTNPPIEIARQGNKVILKYWAEQEFTTLHEAKVLLVGDPNSGKTTLIRRMTWPEMVMPGAGDRTRGIDIHEMKYALPDGKEMRLNVWDFAGQEVRHATHQFFFTERSIYVLLDDTSENHEGESDPYFRKWLHWIRLMGGESPVLIFQNEKDSKSRGIRFKEIQAQFPLVEELHRGDLALVGSADGFKAALQALAPKLGHMGSRWPVKWVRIRELLEQEAKKEPIITYKRFMGICKEAKEDDPKSVAILAKFFHDLGVLLHYHEDEFLREWVIIDNQWATDAVYLLMTDEEVKQQGRGRFGLEDLGRIWAEERFMHFHAVLTSLMERFDLCYSLKDTQPRQWLIPQMLGPSSPDALEFGAEGGDLVVDYCYDFAPKGLVNRLMTRHHRLVQDPEMAWKSGVLFEDGHASLLATYDGLKETIHLRAKGGRLDQLALMRSVSRELESIHGLFRNILVDKLLPCTCGFCKTQPFPAMYPMKELLERLERNPGSRKQCGNPKNHDETLVPVRELMNGFWGETMADGKPSGLSVEDREFVSGELGKVRRHFDDRFDTMEDRFNTVDESLSRIEVFTEAIPQVMNRLIGIKEYQGTIFQDLKAMAHRLDEKVSANQEDSQAILERIEEALAAVTEAMSPEQRAELEAAMPKDQGNLKTVLGKIKFKVPIVPLAYAIISGWEPASLALLGTALSRSLDLDATIPEHAKALVRVWDDLKFRVANLILAGGR